MEFVKIFTGYLHRKMLYFSPSNRIHIFHFGNLCKKGTSQNAKSML